MDNKINTSVGTESVRDKYDIYRHCELCPRRCHVDRIKWSDFDRAKSVDFDRIKTGDFDRTKTGDFDRTKTATSTELNGRLRLYKNFRLLPCRSRADRRRAPRCICGKSPAYPAAKARELSFSAAARSGACTARTSTSLAHNVTGKAITAERLAEISLICSRRARIISILSHPRCSNRI